MHCPTHGTTITLPAPGHDDIEIACPECRQLWSDRGEIYELPPRGDDAGDAKSPPPTPG